MAVQADPWLDAAAFQSRLASKTTEYLYQVGSRTVRLPANEEVIAHFERGLSSLETLPETDESVFYMGRRLGELLQILADNLT